MLPKNRLSQILINAFKGSPRELYYETFLDNHCLKYSEYCNVNFYKILIDMNWWLLIDMQCNEFQ